MKRSQSKQPSSKPALKSKRPLGKPLAAAAKSALKKTTDKPSSPKTTSRKPAAAARKPRSPVPSSASLTTPVSTDASQSKQSQLIAMLGSASGASMAQMTSLTGWQRHTVRGAISGALRKRLGLNVQCRVEEGVRIYRILEALAA